MCKPRTPGSSLRLTSLYNLEFSLSVFDKSMYWNVYTNFDRKGSVLAEIIVGGRKMGPVQYPEVLGLPSGKAL